MSNLYVSLDEVEKFLISEYGFGKFQIESIRGIPTINISVIDEMIEERSKLIGISDTFGSPRLAGKSGIHALQELKQRLSHNK